jgi:molecular chaperone GrpE
VSDVETKKNEDEQDEAEAAAVEPSPLEQAEAERDRMKDQLLRVAADFDNFRKRTKKDLELAERKAKEEVVRELLPVFDNLERAVAAARETSDVESVASGIEMVLKLFEDAAGRIGLERLRSVGERFDPNVHDAFQQRESAEHPAGTILAEFQSGYRLGEHLVRPAMVVVSKRPPEAG